MLKHGEALNVYQAQEAKPTRGRSKRSHVPDFIKDKPSLDIALVFYWDSFNNLSTERMVDGGSIPYSAMMMYCRVHKVKDFESFLTIIRKMDSVMLQHHKDRISNGS